MGVIQLSFVEAPLKFFDELNWANVELYVNSKYDEGDIHDSA